MNQEENQDQTTAQAAPAQDGVATISLQTPIKRGATEITSLKLRKPNTGALRGVSLADLLQMNVSALQVVLPRISEPTLVKHEVDQLDPADLVACALEVAGFLVPKAAMESPQP
ncbi:phage tail assembly protein [Comamonas resistens]|uniref:phage tail assembly protein n=1 Tax=Comamonas resistens TaxID=3046670 RepID=UPI0039BC3E3B